jgi:hypothetical protein
MVTEPIIGIGGPVRGANGYASRVMSRGVADRRPLQTGGVYGLSLRLLSLLLGLIAISPGGWAI